jgi:hypothetical protein
MNDQNETAPMHGDALTDDEMAQAVGGDTEPGGPGDDNGVTNEATPILF